MLLENNLEQLGLTDKQAKVYLAALELGSDTVQNIAEKAQIKRPTAYVIIHELISKGFLSKQPTQKGGTLYVAETPEKFLGQIEQQQRVLQDTLPLLRALYHAEKGKPEVRVYEGEQGIVSFYEEYLFKTTSEISFFTSVKKLIDLFPTAYESWMSVTELGRSTKELLNPDPEDIEYAQRCLARHTKQQFRVIPPLLKARFAASDCAIFEDKIMLVSFEEKLFTTVIQSQILASTLRTLFELAWQSAMPIEEFVRQYPEYGSSGKNTAAP